MDRKTSLSARSVAFLTLCVGLAPALESARVFAIPQDAPAPTQGLPDVEYVRGQLDKSPDMPSLSPLSASVWSLFHSSGKVSSHPAVVDSIIFAWQDGDQLLIADSSGRASYKRTARDEWINGWIDYAKLSQITVPEDMDRDVDISPIRVLWQVRLENRTEVPVTLIADPGNRPLDVVQPGQVLERPVVARAAYDLSFPVATEAGYWLRVGSGPLLSLGALRDMRFCGSEAVSALVRKGGFRMEVTYQPVSDSYIVLVHTERRNTPTVLIASVIIFLILIYWTARRLIMRRFWRPPT
ncbi:MAG: hypothetical protein KatS3mg015_2686 [Fimbriimonadales bacterium]|nr:MAG: hypothetical protein KatS3mg015_2682 [Fimbriimonadales bacterium]GIV03856.1 MAG: hypothetical protein KatS3mg015_2686 [Fimbriimonadales bacterium]